MGFGACGVRPNEFYGVGALYTRSTPSDLDSEHLDLAGVLQ